MNVQIVVGANYGDEGKGLVSGSLARKAYEKGEKCLTVFYNGTSQRAHTFKKQAFRSIAGGSLYGSDTFYHQRFVVDPISLWISGAQPIISPECRVILPCDVIRNRKSETERGQNRHGSCGFGLFECVKRSKDPNYILRFQDLMTLEGYTLYKRLKDIEKVFGPFDDDLYNMECLMMAIDKLKKSIQMNTFFEIAKEYETIIFEGGQGLLLDQDNKDGFPYLTPSSTGNRDIQNDVKLLSSRPDIYYVTRSYMTRHGAGPMEAECQKEDINPSIVDRTNQPNEFQGELRFGKINIDSLENRIKKDSSVYDFRKRTNLVVTQTNYTNGKIFTTDGPRNLTDKPLGIDRVWASDQEDHMELVIA